MEPLHEVFVVALLICAASGHHFLRGCQDVDPKCALLDEMRAAGDTAEAQRMCDAGTDHYCSKTCNKCGQYTDSQNVVMLVGGRKNKDDYYLNPSFFSLNGSSLPACLDSTKNDIHPSLSETRTPALFINQDGNPVMCVGHQDLDECFEYDASSDSWSIIGETSGGYARGWDYFEDVGLIIAGGQKPDLQTVEMSTDGGQTFEYLADIPYGRPTYDERIGPCVVILDNNTAFVAGGADGRQEDRFSYCATYFLDLTTKAWTPGPNMTHCRFYHTCNMILNETSGQREIVVVGGFDQQRQDHCKYIQEVEIFNLDTLQWRNATDFPKPIARQGTLYFEDTFLILGGDRCTDCTDCSCTSCASTKSIHQYNKGDDTWTQLAVKLPEKMYLQSAMFVENLC